MLTKELGFQHGTDSTFYGLNGRFSGCYVQWGMRITVQDTLWGWCREIRPSIFQYNRLGDKKLLASLMCMATYIPMIGILFAGIEAVEE